MNSLLTLSRSLYLLRAPLFHDCRQFIIKYPGAQLISLRQSSTKSPEEDDDLDKPIKFTTSRAAKWTARNTFGGTSPEDTPEIQGLSISLSIIAFLVYFCILREENDFDEGLETNLWERLPGLERSQLELISQENEAKGLDNTAVKARIMELDAIEAAKKQ